MMDSDRSPPRLTEEEDSITAREPSIFIIDYIDRINAMGGAAIDRGICVEDDFAHLRSSKRKKKKKNVLLSDNERPAPDRERIITEMGPPIDMTPTVYKQKQYREKHTDQDQQREPRNFADQAPAQLITQMGPPVDMTPTVYNQKQYRQKQPNEQQPRQIRHFPDIESPRDTTPRQYDDQPRMFVDVAPARLPEDEGKRQKPREAHPGHRFISQIGSEKVAPTYLSRKTPAPPYPEDPRLVPEFGPGPVMGTQQESPPIPIPAPQPKLKPKKVEGRDVRTSKTAKRVKHHGPKTGRSRKTSRQRRKIFGTNEIVKSEEIDRSGKKESETAGEATDPTVQRRKEERERENEEKDKENFESQVQAALNRMKRVFVDRGRKSGAVDMRFKASKANEAGLPPGSLHFTRVYGKPQPLKRQYYFHGILPRMELEAMLKRSGDYLVRLSHQKDNYIPSIAVRADKQILHFLISQTMKNHYHIGGHTFDSVMDLVDWYESTGTVLSISSSAILRHPIERQAWQLTHDQVRLENKLGEGAFGQVYKGVLILGSQGIEVAVKIAQRAATRQQRAGLLQEFRTMWQFSHQNVVKVYGLTAECEPLMIVMEYLAGGSLLAYLRANTVLVKLQDRLRFCVQAAAGMRYLEKKKCIHRDVAARNCLMDLTRNVKIGDFGQSLFDATYKQDKTSNAPIRWSAPETLRTGMFSQSTDVWSFGILMWEIFSDGAQPYPGMTNAQVKLEVTSKCYRMRKPVGIPDRVINLIDSCWKEFPNERPTFTKLYKLLREIDKSRPKN